MLGDLVAHVEAVHVGEVQVEADQVVRGDREALSVDSTDRGDVHRIALMAQPRGDRAREVGLVFDDRGFACSFIDDATTSEVPW